MMNSNNNNIVTTTTTTATATAIKSVNNCYLAKLVLIVSLTSSGFGFALVTTNELSDTYKMHFKWSAQEKEDNITWLTCASALGLMLGSLLSSSIVKIGRRKAIIFASIIATISALL